jgi:hypothetical protein
MATLIATADGNLTGATTFAAVEIGTGAFKFNRFANNGPYPAAGTTTSLTFTVTNGSVIDAVFLWLKQASTGSTGTVKIDLLKGGVSQASVTVNKTDLPSSNSVVWGPTVFKLTSTAVGDGGSNWAISVITTGTVGVTGMTASGVNFDWPHALRTTTTQTPAAADDLYICGELTGAGTNNTRIVTMDSIVATAYGNGLVNSTTVAGGGIHISNWGTLAYATAASTNYIMRVFGDVIVYQYGTLSIGASGAEIPRSSTAVLEIQQLSADGQFGLLCYDNSVVNIAGLSRTAGKNVTQCKLIANYGGGTTVGGFSGTGGSFVSGPDPTGTSLVGSSGWQENGLSQTHHMSAVGPAVNNITQIIRLWLKAGPGTHNRYVRIYMGDSSAIPPSPNGAYWDVDLQLGTVSAGTVIGAGAVTSGTMVSGGAVGWYLITLTGKIKTTGATTNSYCTIAACSAVGTTTYLGTNDISFYVYGIGLHNSAPATSAYVDADTGWLYNDVVCIATSNQSQTQCELAQLTSDATTNSLPTVLGSAYAHVGSEPTQAEIGLLTRNVRFRSTSPTLMTYMYCTALSTVTVSWAEFYYIGMESDTKRGIDVPGGTVTNPKSFTYCSIHDCDQRGFFCNQYASASLNLTFSNNVGYNSYGNVFVTINAAVTANDWVMDNNLIMRCQTLCYSLGDVGGSFYNNTAVGGQDCIGIYESNVIGNLDNMTCHATSNLINCYSTLSGTIRNFKAYHGNNGICFNGSQPNLVWVDPFVIGSGFGGDFRTAGTDFVNVIGGTFAGSTAVISESAVILGYGGLGFYNFYNVDMTGVGTGLATHTQWVIKVPSTTFAARALFNNCKFGPLITNGAYDAAAKAYYAGHAWMSFHNFNQVAGDHRTEVRYGQLRRDAAIYKTALPSLRMSPNNASLKLPSAPLGRALQVAVNSGDTVTASVWVRKDVTYTGNQPRLVVRANPAVGINTDTVLAACTDVTVSEAPVVLDSVGSESVATNNNLTITRTTWLVLNESGARSTVTKTTGKYYFEFTCGETDGNNTVGLVLSTGNYDNMRNGLSCSAFFITYGPGWIYSNNASQTTISGAHVNGDIISCAVDLDARKVWFRKNGGNWNANATYNPATNVGGFTVAAGAFAPAVGSHSGSANVVGDTVTANFGQTAYAYAVPSGFVNWGYPVGSPGTATWVQITGTTPAATDDGMMEFIVDCDGAGGFIHIDDWSITTGGVTTTNNMTDWVSGLPVSNTVGAGGGGAGGYFAAGFV